MFRVISPPSYGPKVQNDEVQGMAEIVLFTDAHSNLTEFLDRACLPLGLSTGARLTRGQPKVGGAPT